MAFEVCCFRWAEVCHSSRATHTVDFRRIHAASTYQRRDWMQAAVAWVRPIRPAATPYPAALIQAKADCRTLRRVESGISGDRCAGQRAGIRCLDCSDKRSPLAGQGASDSGTWNSRPAHRARTARFAVSALATSRSPGRPAHSKGLRNTMVCSRSGPVETMATSVPVISSIRFR